MFNSLSHWATMAFVSKMFAHIAHSGFMTEYIVLRRILKRTWVADCSCCTGTSSAPHAACSALMFNSTDNSAVSLASVGGSIADSAVHASSVVPWPTHFVRRKHRTFRARFDNCFAASNHVAGNHSDDFLYFPTMCQHTWIICVTYIFASPHLQSSKNPNNLELFLLGPKSPESQLPRPSPSKPATIQSQS